MNSLMNFRKSIAKKLYYACLLRFRCTCRRALKNLRSACRRAVKNLSYTADVLSQILRYTCRRALKNLGYTAYVLSQILKPVDDLFKILTEAIPNPEDVLLHLCTFKPRRLKCQKVQRFINRVEEHLAREEPKK